MCRQKHPSAPTSEIQKQHNRKINNDAQATNTVNHQFSRRKACAAPLTERGERARACGKKKSDRKMGWRMI